MKDIMHRCRKAVQFWFVFHRDMLLVQAPQHHHHTKEF